MLKLLTKRNRPSLTNFRDVSFFEAICEIFVVELLAIQESADVKVRRAQSQQHTTDDFRGNNAYNDQDNNNTNDHALFLAVY